MIERLQVVDAFADAHEAHRQPRGGGDGHQHPGLRGAVQLGHRKAGDADRLVELGHLGEGVLADAGIEHQQHFVGGSGVQAAHHALDLAQFVHQAGLGLQAAGRVRQHDVDAPRLGGGDRVEDHRGAVGALALGHHRHVVALPPLLQLLHRGGAEGVAGGEQHARVFLAQTVRELADERRLAGAVDADHQHYMGPLRADVEGHGHGFEDRREFRCKRTVQSLGVGEFAPRHAVLEGFHHALGGGDSDIGGQQAGFQILEDVVVDGALAKQQVADAGAQALPRLAERGVQAPPEGQPCLGLRALVRRLRSPLLPALPHDCAPP